MSEAFNRLIGSLLLLVSIIACDSRTTLESKDYSLIYDEGIYVEKFDSTNTHENRYTDNNTTYIEGRVLTYDYYYQDLTGRKYKFKEEEGASELDFRDRVKAWTFVPIDSITDETIEQVELEVEYGLDPFLDNNPDYNQTVISYAYPQVNGNINFSSSTGVIENEKNVWMHPPRDRFFRILEINPFPFIQAPYEIGSKWNWTLKIGSFWGDERWKTWESSIENRYEYVITNKSRIPTKLGDLECFEIKSTATSSIGITHLTSYFNMDMGFVKLDYTNIDSTKTVLELVGLKEPEIKN